MDGNGEYTRPLVEEFAAVMGSDTPYHYTLVPRKGKHGEKIEGRYFDVMGKPTREDWEDHLHGGTGLSIVLNCAGPDGVLDHTRRALADVDEYGDDAVLRVLKGLREHQLPAVPTLSKSGGVHANLFFKEAIPAERARRLVGQVRAVLGVKAEIFPKQIEVNDTDRRGNGINVTYFGSTRPAVKLGAGDTIVKLSLEEFVAEIAVKTIPMDELEELERRLPVPEPERRSNGKPDPAETMAAQGRNKPDQPFYQGPPCLQTLVAAGAKVKSHRNNFLYNVGVFHVFVEPMIEQDKLIDFLLTANLLYCDPPLKAGDVTATARSVFKAAKKASYMCNEEPICSVCSREVCKSRRYGVALKGMALPFTIEVLQPDVVTATNFLEDRPVLHVVDRDGIPLTLKFDGFADPNFGYAYIRKVLRHRTDIFEGLDRDSFETMMDSAIASAHRTVLKPERQEAGIAVAALEAYQLASSLLADAAKIKEFFSDGLQLTGFWFADGKRHGARTLPPADMTDVIVLDRFINWSVVNASRIKPERLRKGLDQLEELGLAHIAGRSINLTRERAVAEKKGTVWVQCIYFNPTTINAWRADMVGVAPEVDDPDELAAVVPVRRDEGTKPAWDEGLV